MFIQLCVCVYVCVGVCMYTHVYLDTKCMDCLQVITGVHTIIFVLSLSNHIYLLLFLCPATSLPTSPVPEAVTTMSDRPAVRYA